MKFAWWSIVACVLGLFPGVLRAQHLSNCRERLPRETTVSAATAGEEPLLSSAFAGALGTGLRLEALEDFFQRHPGLRERLGVGQEGPNLSIVPSPLLEDRLRFQGPQERDGVQVEGGRLQLVFEASSGRLLSLSFLDVAGWDFARPEPEMDGDAAAEVATAALAPVLGDTRIQAEPGLLYTALPSGRFALTWETLVFARGSVFEGRTVMVDAHDGEILFVGPALPDPSVPQLVRFLRGDANGDGTVNLTDPVRLMESLFRGEEERVTCRDAADANGDLVVNLTDAVHSLQHLFLGGGPLPPPFPGCGFSPSGIGCACYPACR